MTKIPNNYSSVLNYQDTMKAIKLVKDTFQKQLAISLNLLRVSAPLFVAQNTGLNDELNGFEKSVAFTIKQDAIDAEIIHSLAKWKRMALKKYDFKELEGLYTDMNAIRKEEELSNIHSVYVDQWDWERIINPNQRNVETFKEHVCNIVKSLKITQDILLQSYPNLQGFVNDEVFFITSEELLQKFPNLSAKERELAITREHKTVCIMQIGDYLSNNTLHDGRAADYDDWSLNGDILIYYPILDIALEISSMGIRVNKETLKYQLKVRNQEDKLQLDFHQQLVNGNLPQTIGGGIGQSRICMLLLNKVHIGEVQSSLWDKQTVEICEKNKVILL